MPMSDHRMNGFQDSDGVQVYRLADCWDDSIEAPLRLWESDEPLAQAGTYVIEPDERVPQEGTTSHDGDEFSVILEGKIRLGSPILDQELIIDEGNVIVIPAGFEHYSVNRGDGRVKLVYVVLGEL